MAAVREFGAVRRSSSATGPRSSAEVQRLDAQGLALEVRHASQVVGMAESPSQALRRKRDSSLRVAAELVKAGEAAAFISAGNTGAAMAIAMFVIGVLPGIDRPAIAAVLPSLPASSRSCSTPAPTWIPRPEHLLPVRGHGSRLRPRHPRPRAARASGSLSVGEEEGKGNEPHAARRYEQLRGVVAELRRATSRAATSTTAAATSS